jgi:DNA modification methylase
MPKAKPAAPAAWRSRIVGDGEEAPDQLLANPFNFRIHPKAQQDALTGALNEIGWIQRVIVNQRTGHVIDGHARIALAISREEPTVPVVYVDLDENEERIALASLDPLAAMAVQDPEKWNELLAEISVSDADLRAMLQPVGVKDGLTDPDDVPAVVEPTSKTGDLWLLGEHRLLCGDSTKGEDVGRLMDGATIELVWTDPPYGVSVGDKNKFLNSIARCNRVEKNLTGDTLGEPALMAMLCASFDLALASCTAGAAWYVAAPAGPLHVLFGLALKERGIWHQTIQWVKNNATFSPMGVDYHWQAEPIFYGWVPNAAHRYRGGRQQTTVWNIDRPSKSPEHPTMKPVELVERAVTNSSDVGHVVYDPFLGSGTTLIACERLGRRCYAMEIEPKYVDVAVRRWEQFTGREAHREGPEAGADESARAARQPVETRPANARGKAGGQAAARAQAPQRRGAARVAADG